MEAEIRTEEKTQRERKENRDLISYFDASEIEKENIECNTLVNIIKEENEYFEKRSNKHKLLLQLEDDKFIHETEFEKMKSQLRDMEASKACLMKELTIKNNELRMLEERERELSLKKAKNEENLEKIQQSIDQNDDTKNNLLGKIQDGEIKRKVESDKLRDLIENVQIKRMFPIQI